MRKLGPLLAALVLLLGATSAYAQSSTRAVSWQRYDVDLALQPDGSMNVTETQTVAFQGTYQQGSRSIPLGRSTGITDVSVTESINGQTTPLQVSTQTNADQLDITWAFQPITNGSATFALHYVAHGVVRLYASGDQLDWNAIWAGRPGAVAAGTVRVTLPAAAPTDAIRAASYLFQPNRTPTDGPSGTIANGTSITYTVTNLSANDGLEIRTQFPHGLLTQATEPPWQPAADRADAIQQSLAPIANFLTLLLTLAVLAGGGAGLFLLWYTHGREIDPGPVPPTLDTPPSELPAPLVGTLVDGRADLRDAISTLVDLARRGVVTLEDANGDVRVTLHGRAEDPSLRRYERVMLVALFDRGATSGEVLLSSARVRFAAAVPVLEERLYEAVVEDGLFEANPDLTRRRYLRLGGLVAAIGAVLAIGLAISLGWLAPVWLPAAALVLLGGALVWLAPHMPRRTPRGALEAARWRAFRQHLLSAPRSDEHLAYAVALGVDRQYLQQLALQSGSTAPAVYAPSGPGGLIFFPGWYGRGGNAGNGQTPAPQGGPAGTASPAGVGGPQGWSDALADLLNAASGALSHGGGSGPWSGGGWGGGGGGGGGSGGWS
jgi:Predicted membrane protein (DUF2207)